MDIEFIKKIKLDPGDVVVVKVNGGIFPAGMRNIQQDLKSTFPGHKFLILDDTVELSIIGKQDLPDGCICFGPPEPNCPTHGVK